MQKNINYILMAVMAMAVISCKKYPDDPAVFEDLVRNVERTRKVLLISIDGLTGSELQTIAPTNIAELQKNAKYSYNTLPGASDAAGWASMVTGTTAGKHRIIDDSFDQEDDPDADEHAEVPSYRNVFDYVTQYKATKTALVTPWENLRNYIKNPNFIPVVNTDAAVKDSVVNLLNTQQGLGTLFVNFRDVLEAGTHGGYLATNENYKNAILKTDEYVGNILTALRARRNFADEDWLVIITTNHGGSSQSPKSGFTLLYNPAFAPFELKKQGFNSVLFNNVTAQAIVPNDQGLYNMGANQDFTVQMQLKMAPIGANIFPGFLSKSNDASTNFTGWLWYQNQANMTMCAGGNLNGGPTGRVNIGGIGPVADNTWHTVTMTVKRINPTTRTMTAYVDGVVKGTPANINDRLNISSSEPLRFGRRAVDNPANPSFATFNSANLLIFNTALDPAVINANQNLKDITQHPNYANLIGYWPMDEGAENSFINKAPTGYDMSLSGAYSWTSLGSNYPPGTTPEPVDSPVSVITTTSDIAALTLYWMKVTILPEFSYDGKPYLKNFELEFLKN